MLKFRLHYVGIRVTDLDRSVDFYCNALGLRAIARGSMSHGGLYADLMDETTGQRIELNWYPPDSPFCSDYLPGEGLDHIGFEVENAEEAFRVLTAERGADEAMKPWKEGDTTLAFVKDPDGIWIELSSREV